MFSKKEMYAFDKFLGEHLSQILFAKLSFNFNFKGVINLAKLVSPSAALLAGLVIATNFK